MKQMIIVRTDLKMSKGKLAVQASHAAVAAAQKADKKIISSWTRGGQKKVAVKVKTEKELLSLQDKCRKLKINHYLVCDAGLTELKPGTATALAIGPDKEEKVNKVTGSLPLLA